MLYYLLCFEGNQSQQHSDSPMSKFLQERGWKDLIKDGHGQTFGMIHCEDSLESLRSSIEALLAEGARMFLKEIQPENLPLTGCPTDWLRNNARGWL